MSTTVKLNTILKDPLDVPKTATEIAQNSYTIHGIQIGSASTVPQKMFYECVLNMIVKNESHCILSTLENVLEQNKIAGRMVIDGYIIMDTGSTDGTQQMIRDFFNARGLPGEVIDDPWPAGVDFDFGINRTKAIRYCKGRARYALIMDADDLIEGWPFFLLLLC